MTLPFLGAKTGLTGGTCALLLGRAGGEAFQQAFHALQAGFKFLELGG